MACNTLNLDVAKTIISIKILVEKVSLEVLLHG